LKQVSAQFTTASSSADRVSRSILLVQPITERGDRLGGVRGDAG